MVPLYGEGRTRSLPISASTACQFEPLPDYLVGCRDSDFDGAVHQVEVEVVSVSRDEIQLFLAQAREVQVQALARRC